MVAAILLVAGGLNALQTATIVSALPFAVIMLLLALGILRGMMADLRGRDLMREYHHAPGMVAAGAGAWRRRLSLILRPPREEDVERFIDEQVVPAWRLAVRELERRGISAEIQDREGRGKALVVPGGEARDFVYGVQAVTRRSPGLLVRTVNGSKGGPQIWMAVTYFADGRQGYNIMGFATEQIIADMLDQYEIYTQLVESPETGLYITSPENPAEI